MLAVRAFGVPSKQELLLFDDIAVTHPRLGPSRTQAELDFLEEENLIRRVDLTSLLKVNAQYKIDPTLITQARAKKIAEECRLFGGHMHSEMIEHIFSSHFESIRQTPRGYDYADHPGNDPLYNDLTRLIAAILRYVYFDEAVGVLREDRSARDGYTGYKSRMPFSRVARRELPESLRRFLPETPSAPDEGLSAQTSLPLQGVTRNEQIYEVVLSRMPIPSDITPWEDIIEFRNDPSTRLRFLDLHRWVKKMIREDHPIKDLREELEYLLLQHDVHMKRHRVRYRYGKLRVLLSFGAGLLENTIKLKLKELVDLPFQFAERMVTLNDAESGSPGKEVSYIIQSHERFGG